jgi:hypothetical protein
MSVDIANIWLEFEEWQHIDLSEHPHDFFNMKIRLSDGREYALNVWTLAYAGRLRDELLLEQSRPFFALGPDIIVEVADRGTLQAVAEELVRQELLREDWLVRP